MRRNSPLCAIPAAAAVLAAAVLAAAAADTRAPKGWPRMKSLAGEWSGTDSAGKPIAVTYQLTAGGSALLETIRPTGEEAMVTVYHPDGDRLLMTHYCSTGNQPRMRAEVGDRTIAFDLVDATNLADRSTPHMRRLVITFLDGSHIQAEWTLRSGREDQPVTFDLHRRK